MDQSMELLPKVGAPFLSIPVTGFSEGDPQALIGSENRWEASKSFKCSCGHAGCWQAARLIYKQRASSLMLTNTSRYCLA